MYFSSLVVELLSNISEIAGSNPSSYIMIFFKTKVVFISDCISRAEHACVHFVLCFYQTKALDPCMKMCIVHERQRELITAAASWTI